MTVKELYEWAQKYDCEDYELVMDTNKNNVEWVCKSLFPAFVSHMTKSLVIAMEE